MMPYLLHIYSSTLEDARHGAAWKMQGHPQQRFPGQLYSIVCPPVFTFDLLSPYLIGLSTPAGKFGILQVREILL